MTHDLNPAIPNGMTEVTPEEFFKILYSDRRDIMPDIGEPNFTIWRVVQTRQPWGFSTPGWKYPDRQAKRYAVNSRLISRLTRES